MEIKENLMETEKVEEENIKEDEYEFDDAELEDAESTFGIGKLLLLGLGALTIGGVIFIAKKGGSIAEKMACRKLEKKGYLVIPPREEIDISIDIPEENIPKDEN